MCPQKRILNDPLRTVLVDVAEIASKVRAFSMRKAFLWSVALAFHCLLLAPSSHAQTVETLKPLPRNCHPGDTFFQGPDGYLYGVLKSIGLPLTAAQMNMQASGLALPTSSGVVYRMSPSGALKYLHVFPYLKNSGNTNATGSEVTDLISMGSDGFLYGITRGGGNFARGVFYRLSTDGTFEVLAHLHGVIPSQFNGFVQRADGAFYTFYNDSDQPDLAYRLFRFSADGTFGPIGDRLPTYFGRLIRDPESLNQVIISWTDDSFVPPVPWRERENKLRIAYLDTPTGNLLSDQTYIPFPKPSDGVGFRGVVGGKFLVYTSTIDLANNAPGRLATMDKTTGAVTSIADFSMTEFESNGLPPHLNRLYPVTDGSFYFSGGSATKETFTSNGAGAKLFHLKPTGEWKEVCDFGGYPFVAFCEGRDDVFYGISMGPSVEPVEGLGAKREAVRSRVSAPRTWTPPTRRGTFRLIPEGATSVNLAPYLKTDNALLRRPVRSIITATPVKVLRNDHDPEETTLTLEEVSAPKFGSVSVETTPKGVPIIVYTPNDPASSSEVLHYRVADANAQTSEGLIQLRGLVAGRYRAVQDQAAVPHTLTVSVLANGRFSFVAKIEGKTLRGSGRLNYDDLGRVSGKLRDGTVWSLEAELKNDSPGVKVAAYKLKFGGLTVNGSATR